MFDKGCKISFLKSFYFQIILLK